MKTVATFTRHALTDQQVVEMSGPVSADLTSLASRNISSQEEARDIYLAVMERLKDVGPDHVDLYGVIPAPLRAVMLAESKAQEGDHGFTGWTVTLWEAFNVQRSTEGGKPTFVHLAWVKTGIYCPYQIQ